MKPLPPSLKRKKKKKTRKRTLDWKFSSRQTSSDPNFLFSFLRVLYVFTQIRIIKTKIV